MLEHVAAIILNFCAPIGCFVYCLPKHEILLTATLFPSLCLFPEQLYFLKTIHPRSVMDNRITVNPVKQKTCLFQ
jgi:hypothetical protein